MVDLGEWEVSGEIELTIDALTGAKLASVGFVTDKQKNRRLQLHNPDESVGFDNTSKMYVLPLNFMTEADDIGDS
jgi:hypothetical protein